MPQAPTRREAPGEAAGLYDIALCNHVAREHRANVLLLFRADLEY